jgi:hypothetical protein
LALKYGRNFMSTAPSLEQIARVSKQCLRHRRVMRSTGDRSGCVVTTPTGITGFLIRKLHPTRADQLGQSQRRFDQRKCAPMQTRAPTPNGRSAKRSGCGEGGMKRDGMNAFAEM